MGAIAAAVDVGFLAVLNSVRTAVEGRIGRAVGLFTARRENEKAQSESPFFEI